MQPVGSRRSIEGMENPGRMKLLLRIAGVVALITAAVVLTDKPVGKRSAIAYYCDRIGIASPRPEIVRTPQQVTIAVRGGLVNRILVVLSYYMATQAEGKTLRVMWPTGHPHCLADFNRLFLPIPNVTVVAVDASDYGMVTPMPSHLTHPCWNTRTDWDYARDHHALRLLRLRPRLMHSVQQLIERLGNHFVAVHVRRTDLSKLLLKKANAGDIGVEPTADVVFDSFLETYPSAQVFLATDNADTQRRFTEKFGSRIQVAGTIHASSNLRQTSVEQAVVDIYTSAHAAHFQGSGGSTFSSLIDMIHQSRKPYVDNLKEKDNVQAKAEADGDLCRLAAMYHFGVGGVSQDLEKASSFYQKAAAQHFRKRRLLNG